MSLPRCGTIRTTLLKQKKVFYEIRFQTLSFCSVFILKTRKHVYSMQRSFLSYVRESPNKKEDLVAFVGFWQIRDIFHNFFSFFIWKWMPVGPINEEIFGDCDEKLLKSIHLKVLIVRERNSCLSCFGLVRFWYKVTTDYVSQKEGDC